MATRDEKKDFESAGAAAAAFEDQLARLPEALNRTTAAAARTGVSMQSIASKVPAAMNAVKTAVVGVGETVGKVLNGDIRGALDGIGGAIKGGIGKLTGELAKLGPYGQAAAAAITVLTAGVSLLAGSLLDAMGAAIGMAEAGARIKATFAALAGGEAAGGAVLKMVSDLSAKLPFATGQIRTWAQGLLAAGLQGAQLKSAIEAVAAAQAIMGEGGAAAAEKMIKQLAMGGAGADAMLKQIQDGSKKSNVMLAEMGLRTADVAAAMGMTAEQFKKAKLTSEQMNAAIQKALAKKGKGPLDEMMSSWPVILMKAKAGLTSLLGGAGSAIKPFMQSVKSLFGEFNKGSPIIKALTPVVTKILTVAFGLARKAVEGIHGIIKAFKNAGQGTSVLSGAVAVAKVVWTALGSIFTQVAAMIKPLITWLKALFTNAMFIKAVKTVFTGLAIWIGVVVVVLGVLVGAVVLVGSIIATVFATIFGVVASVFGAVAEIVGSVVDALSGLGGAASSAGGSFVDGLVGGITAGVGAVVAAVSGLANKMLSAFTGPLGIHSPSDVMDEHGEVNTAGAYADGLTKGKGKVDSAMARLGDARPSAKGGKGGAGGGLAEKIVFEYHGPSSDFDDFAEKAERWLEQWAARGTVPETV